MRCVDEFNIAVVEGQCAHGIPESFYCAQCVDQTWVPDGPSDELVVPPTAEHRQSSILNIDELDCDDLASSAEALNVLRCDSYRPPRCETVEEKRALLEAAQSRDIDRDE